MTRNRLYGQSFKERKDLPVHHPDVRVYEVLHESGPPMAKFLTDYFARDNKPGGAWMNEYVSQSRLLGLKSVVANCLNIVKPPEGRPVLPSFDELTTTGDPSTSHGWAGKGTGTDLVDRHAAATERSPGPRRGRGSVHRAFKMGLPLTPIPGVMALFRDDAMAPIRNRSAPRSAAGA